MITFEQFKELYDRFSNEDANKWLDSIPSEIKDGYFDNPLVNDLHSTIEFTLGLLLGESLRNDLYATLYDGFGDTYVGDKVYPISNDKEFLFYVKEEYFS